MIGYIKTFKDKGGEKNKDNKSMSLDIDDDKLLEKYKTISTKIKDLLNVKLNVLLVYDDRYMKTKKKTYVDKVYTNVCGFNVPEDGVVC